MNYLYNNSIMFSRGNVACRITSAILQTCFILVLISVPFIYQLNTFLFVVTVYMAVCGKICGHL